MWTIKKRDKFTDKRFAYKVLEESNKLTTELPIDEIKRVVNCEK